MYSTAFWCLIVVYWFFWLYCVTTVTPFIERSKGWQQAAIFFFAEIQIRCKFFGSRPRGKPLLPLWEIGSKKDP